MTSVIKDKLIISTLGVKVISSNREGDFLSYFNHEEADKRIFVHIKDAALKGHRRVVIRTVDTDVVVLVIYTMQYIEIDEMWILFGVGKKSKNIPIHKICKILTPE